MRSVCLLLVVLIPLLASSAGAQPVGLAHRVEISPFYGYAWTGSKDVRVMDERGEADVADSGFWGATVDFNVRPGMQAEFQYIRQPSKVTFKSYETVPRQKVDLFDAAVEYYQIGAVAGILRNGKVLPFTKLTAGLSRLIPDAAGADDEWRFSVMAAVGAKIYASEKVGLRLEAAVPWTWLEGGGSFVCGSGGCYTSIGGTGLAQFQVSAGIVFLLGS